MSEGKPVEVKFTVETALDRIAPMMTAYPKAAMFALADEGFDSLFEQLISCIISIRTYDEVSLPASRRLFAQARTPAALNALPVAEIEAIIEPSTYAERKAQQISAIAQQIVEQHGGDLPAEVDLLRSFKGVGPKCAHLALGIGAGQPYISVDTHVHRVVNRWGLVNTKTPEKTFTALEAQVARSRWVDINRILMPFGKYVCTTAVPQCSSCPVKASCAQVGVSTPR
ncbi:MAG: endonuclease III domain-containing protein [Elainellaceae cyanobacterium]